MEFESKTDLTGRQWTRRDIYRLILLYKNLPVLWNPQHPEYRVKPARNEAVKSLMLSFKKSREEIKNKLRNIATQYARERLKYLRSKRPGSTRVFIPTWYGYKLMDFLKNRHFRAKELKQTSDQEDRIDIENSEVGKGDDDDIESDGASINNNDNNESSEKVTTHHNANRQVDELQSELDSDLPSKKIPESKTSTRRERSSAAIEDRMMDMIETICEKTEQRDAKDELDLFGDIIVRKIRRLPTHYARCTVQHLIHTLMYEADLGKYDEAKTNTGNANVNSESFTWEKL